MTSYINNLVLTILKQMSDMISNSSHVSWEDEEKLRTQISNLEQMINQSQGRKPEVVFTKKN